MFERQPFGHLAGALVGLACAVGSANAQQLAGCGELPNHAALTAALDKATAEEMSGLNNQMWATLVDRDGVVCAVAFSGADRAAQWPGSRVISAQKASTANAFSLDSSSNSDGSGQATGLALSTANLYAAVQPGGSLYGLQFRNPVDTDVAYRGPHGRHGTPMDPMVGNREGGVNVFGGGLGPVRHWQTNGRRAGGERRYVLRRPQHRLAHSEKSRSRSSRRRWGRVG